MITLCIPTLNNYKGVLDCINSAELGIVKPDRYMILNNGKEEFNFSENFSKAYEIISYGYNLGLAASWNYFIKNTSEIRIITNDDIIFATDTIGKMANSEGNFVCVNNIQGLNAFSLFRIDDSLINAVGMFDEEISPHYGWFEDNDYMYRAILSGKLDRHSIDSEVIHAGSQTMKNYSAEELEMHHKKFRRAREFYKAKWGGMPNEEKFIIPFNGNKEQMIKRIMPWQRY